MKYIIVIPARYKSSRFPGKPLVDLDGKSMIQRTYEQCIKVVPEELVFVATEDERIVSHCHEHKMNVLLTTDNCLTGTDRVAEVAKLIEADYYINVQGDEPLFNPDDITKVIESISLFNGDIINGFTSITEVEHYNSVSVPKVVFRPDGRLLYMSRSPIPGNKSSKFNLGWRQVCIYAFPAAALKEFSLLGQKTVLEEQEDIEILRFLEMGMEIRMLELSNASIAIDNPEDVIKVENALRHVE